MGSVETIIIDRGVRTLVIQSDDGPGIILVRGADGHWREAKPTIGEPLQGPYRDPPID